MPQTPGLTKMTQLSSTLLPPISLSPATKIPLPRWLPSKAQRNRSRSIGTGRRSAIRSWIGSPPRRLRWATPNISTRNPQRPRKGRYAWTNQEPSQRMRACWGGDWEGASQSTYDIKMYKYLSTYHSQMYAPVVPASTQPITDETNSPHNCPRQSKEPFSMFASWPPIRIQGLAHCPNVAILFRIKHFVHRDSVVTYSHWKYHNNLFIYKAEWKHFSWII